ncbi:MOSC domain-containing protein [Niallia taxi]|uniref:MOSC domain-containing protein n=1 Tax=Niallia taxi TaxID=2499688 RepID=UPI002E229C43|nr:MOSC domain-containing protein [Niallia taxi]
MLIGHIEEIVRHPVKSFRGESVTETNVMEYGLYGDRSHAFADDTRKGKYLTITQFPEMVRYSARFAGEEAMSEYPSVEITTPEGKVMNWGDAALALELEEKSKRKISLLSYTPENVPLGAIEEEHIQLVTDASLEKLKELWGEAAVDHRRFRPNLILSLKDKTPFIEESWFGKRIKIGTEVELQLNRHCERCMIVTVDPDNAERSPSLLKTVFKQRQNNFGVYASVIKTGKIHSGDEVHLFD